MKKIFLLSLMTLFIAIACFASPQIRKHHKHYKHHKHVMKHTNREP